MRLIDAEALIDDIKNHLWDWENVNGITAQTVLKQTITDIKNQPTASPWHRVEEPPKEYGNYLAVVNGEVTEVTYSDMRDDWKWSTCDAEGFIWIRSELVTHWMPLPEPPKEDADGNK